MKLVKSLLLGSAAGICAVAGAQAADLPMRKAAPVEYVRVCTAYGAGFFFIPGTDTCLRVGGRARFEYQYTSQRAKAASTSGFRGLGRLNIDSRTQTAYGTLRAFVRLEIASRTGGFLKSGTQERFANAFTATGVDTIGTAQKFVEIDKAFIQFAGFTAGRASSFFDFYAHDLELIGASVGSDVASTNLLAYTATFGQGFSATVSMEDPVFRRNPVFGTGFVPFSANVSTSGVATGFNALGAPTTFANVDVRQPSKLPDFVGVIRYDQPWGSVQVSAAVHEVGVGVYGATAGTGTVIAAPAVTVATVVPQAPKTEYGFAVQGGLKLNLPQIAPGDVLWLQAAYAEGAGSYTGLFSPQGSELVSSANNNRSAYQGTDSAVDAFGRQHLTTSYSGTIAFLHYYTPEIRQGIFATYGRAQFDRILRTPFGPQGTFADVATTAFPNFNLANSRFSPVNKDYSNLYVGTNLIWSPVKDLDIGVEAVYERLEFVGSANQRRSFDLNKFPTQTFTAPIKTITYDDNVLVRMRVQRDF